jgi:hypothetical protein
MRDCSAAVDAMRDLAPRRRKPYSVQMNPATVLLENVIQGFQTAVWIILLGLTFIDVGAVDLKVFQQNATFFGSVVFASILIAAFYWLGLIVDTAYYHTFIQWREARWFARQRRRGEPQLLEMALVCMLASADLASLLKERQAHLRMFRVSMVNIALITLTLCIFVSVKVPSPKWPVLIPSAVVGAILFATACYVWSKLYKFYVTVIQTGYHAVLEEREASRLKKK